MWLWTLHYDISQKYSSSLKFLIVLGSQLYLYTSGYVQVVSATNAYGNSMKKGSCLTDSTAEFKPTSKNNQLSVHCFKKSMFKWLNKLECTETIVLKAKYKK